MNRTSARLAVHPRACGERWLSVVGTLATFGSSPRLRGTVQAFQVSLGIRRFIPAPAGNGRPGDQFPAAEPVHPRACGERFRVSHDSRIPRGSSPRLRGTEGRMTRKGLPHRFIPAPAGNGSNLIHVHPMRSVHPRACGERVGSLTNGTQYFGSSPRLRGTDGRLPVLAHFGRFIPAPAGNGSNLIHVHPMRSVHPRACGERHPYTDTRGFMTGSSPRLRGTASYAGEDAVTGRFIPAPAGNGPAPRCRSRRGTVHPRACGERHPRLSGRRSSRGSSPRLRGTDRRCADRWPHSRFIPAPAGNGCTCV